MDRSELRTLVRKVTGIDLTNLWSDAEVNDALDRAHQLVCGLAEWSFLVTNETAATTASQATVTLASVDRVLSVAHDEGDPLHQRTVQDLERIPAFRRTSTAKPQAWAVLDDTDLLLHPVPDDAYDLTVRGVAVPAAWTADGDTPAWDDRNLDPAVAYVAAHELCEAEGDDPERVSYLRQQAGQWIGALARQYLSAGQSVEFPPSPPAYNGRGMPMMPPADPTTGSQQQ